MALFAALLVQAPFKAASAESSQPEELVELRTDSAKFYRDPDGTYRARIHPEPIHYRDSSGSWADIRTEIVPSDRPGYAWRNGAGPMRFLFADAPRSVDTVLVEVGSDQFRFGPANVVGGSAPLVAGSTITYPEVWPGIDLRYTVMLGGLKEDLVLKRLPIGDSFTFALGGTLRAAPASGGGLTLTTLSGDVVLVVPPPHMKETDRDGAHEAAYSPSPRLSITTGAGVQTLTVTFDKAWLAHPARVWPVLLDPSTVLPATADTNVYTAFPDTTFGTEDNVRSGSYQSGSLARALMKFSTSGMSNRNITNADLRLYEYHSSSCTAKKADVLRVTESWSESSATWNNRPSMSSTVWETKTFAHGWSSSCPDAWVTLDITSLYQAWADGTYANHGLAIVAANESDTNTWKRFRSMNYSNPDFRPYLDVSYNTIPGTPTSLQPASGTVSSDSTPTLSGLYQDGDPGDNGYVQFEIRRSSDGALISSGNGNTVAPGARSSWTVPSGKLVDGVQYYWRARGFDGVDTGGWTSNVNYRLDMSGPVVTVSSSTHPSQSAWYPSTAPAYSWSATDASGVDGYSYVLDQSATTVPDTVSEGTATSKSYTGITDGTWWFHVRARDGIGTWGATAHFATQIDGTSPLPPSGVSASHATGVPMFDRTVDVSWNAGSDVTSGVAGYSWTFNGSASTPADGVVDGTGTSTTSASLSDGEWYFHVRAIDRAGLASADVVYGPIVIDGTGPDAPILGSSTHTQDAWSAVNDVTFGWTPPGDPWGVAGYSFAFDASPTTDPDTIADTTLTTRVELDVSDGEWWFHVRTVDLAGNWGATAHFRVRIDASSPAMPALTSASHPDQQAWYPDATPAIDAAASDLSGITGVSYSVDQNPHGVPDNTPDSTSLSFDVAALGDGQWYVHVMAVNGSGLWSPAATYGVKVDATPPDVPGPVSSSTHNVVDVTNQRAVSVDWSAVPSTDATSGLAGYTFAFTGSSTWTPDPSVETQATATTSGDLSDGTWYFHVAAVDFAANVSSASTFGPIRIDASAPPVGGTDRQRFLDLWLPRLDQAYADSYLVSHEYDEAILAEGFHVLDEAKKQYLIGELFAATQPVRDEVGYSNEEYDASLLDGLYDYVFNKGAIIDAVAAPNQIFAPLQQILDPLVESIPDEEILALDPSIVDHLPIEEPDLDELLEIDEIIEPELDLVEDAITEPVESALSEAVESALAGVDGAVEDNYPVVVNKVDEVIADAGLSPVTREIFRQLTILPVSPFWTMCWESATVSGCRENNVIGAPAAADVTGDGTLDVTMTLANGAIDLAAPSEIPVVVEASRRDESERNGASLDAHVWAVYDVPFSAQRALIGFDGLTRGRGLPGSATFEHRFRDLAALQSGNPTGRSRFTSASAGSSLALTFGVHQTGTDPAVATDGSLALTPVPALMTATLELSRSDDGATHGLQVSASPDRAVALDGIVTSARPASQERIVSRLVVDSLPPGTTSFELAHTAGAQTTTEIHHRAPAPINRVSFQRTHFDHALVRTFTGDVRLLPAIVDATVVQNGAVPEVDYTAAGIVDRFSFAATEDDGGSRRKSISVRALGVPTRVLLSYGPDSAGTTTFVNYAASGPMGSLDLGLFDRAAEVTMAAAVVDLPSTITGSFSSSDREASIETDGRVGRATLTLTVAGGKLYRPSFDHVTILIPGAGRTMAASVAVTGFVSAHARIDAVSTLSASFFPGGDRLLFSGRFGDTYAVADFAQVPGSVTAVLDRPGLRATYDADRTIAAVSLYAAKRPGGPIVDLALTDVPRTMEIIGATGSDPAIDYEASSRLGSARLMFSSDALPRDGTGTTAIAKLTDVPTRVSIEAHPATRVVKASAPGSIGLAEFTFTRNRGPAEIPAGDHATLTISGSKQAGSVRIGGLENLDVDYDSAGDVSLLLETAGGRPFAVSATIDALRLSSKLGVLPSRIELTIDNHNHLRWDASAAIPTVTFFLTTAGTGPTLSVSAKSVPRVIDVTGRTSPTFHVDYTSEGSGSLGELKALYSPLSLNGPQPPKSGRFGSLMLKQVPSQVTLDVVGDTTSETSSATWAASGTTGEVSFNIRGIPSGVTAFGRATSIPPSWTVSRTKKKTTLSIANGDEIGSLAAGFANNGEIKTLSGNHLRFRAAEFADTFNVSLRVVHAKSFVLDTANKRIDLRSTVDLRGAPFALDVESVGGAPGQQATRDEFLVSAVGTISKLPASIVFRKSSSQMRYEASTHLTANVFVKYGWVPAVASAPNPRQTWGVSVTDGSCSNGATCRVATEEFCDASSCFGLKVKYNFAGMGTVVAVDLPVENAPVQEVSVEDLSPPASKNHFTARVWLSKIDQIFAEVKQEGIPAGVDLHFTKLDVKTQKGKRIITAIVVNNSADLGRLSGTLKQPGETMDRGEDRLRDIEISFSMSSVPRDLDVLVLHGTPGLATVSASSPVSKIRFVLKAIAERKSGNGWGAPTATRAVVEIGDVPASMTTPVSVLVTQPEEADKEPGSADPGEEPIGVDYEACSSDSEGSGSSYGAPVSDPKAGARTPAVSYSAPAAGVDVIVEMSGPIARVSSDTAHANASSFKLSLINLGKRVTAEVFKKNQRIHVDSPDGNTGTVSAEVGFDVTVPCRTFKVAPFTKGPAKFVISGKFDVSIENAKLRLTGVGVRELDIRAGNAYLAYGVEGSYSRFDAFMAPGMLIKSKSKIKVTVYKRPWDWLPKIYEKEIPIVGRYGRIQASEYNHDIEGETGDYYDVRSGPLTWACLAVTGRPVLIGRRFDGARFGGPNPGLRVFTFLSGSLATFPEDDSELQTFINAGVAKVFSPYENRADGKNRTLGATFTELGRGCT